MQKECHRLFSAGEKILKMKNVLNSLWLPRETAPPRRTGA